MMLLQCTTEVSNEDGAGKYIDPGPLLAVRTVQGRPTLFQVLCRCSRQIKRKNNGVVAPTDCRTFLELFAPFTSNRIIGPRPSTSVVILVLLIISFHGKSVNRPAEGYRLRTLLKANIEGQSNVMAPAAGLLRNSRVPSLSNSRTASLVLRATPQVKLEAVVDSQMACTTLQAGRV